jgi:ribosome-associated protein
VRAALESRNDVDRVEAARFRRIEQWRDRLLIEGDTALDALLGAHPDAARGQLAALVARAIDERDRGRPPTASRELFRALRDLLG